MAPKKRATASVDSDQGDASPRRKRATGSCGEVSPGHKRAKPASAETLSVDDEDYTVDPEEAKLVEAMMGISGFSTTKGKDHSATSVSGVMKVSKRKHGQVLGRPKRDAPKPDTKKRLRV